MGALLDLLLPSELALLLAHLLAELPLLHLRLRLSIRFIEVHAGFLQFERTALQF